MGKNFSLDFSDSEIEKIKELATAKDRRPNKQIEVMVREALGKQSYPTAICLDGIEHVNYTVRLKLIGTAKAIAKGVVDVLNAVKTYRCGV